MSVDTDKIRNTARRMSASSVFNGKPSVDVYAAADELDRYRRAFAWMEQNAAKIIPDSQVWIVWGENPDAPVYWLHEVTAPTLLDAIETAMKTTPLEESKR